MQLLQIIACLALVGTIYGKAIELRHDVKEEIAGIPSSSNNNLSSVDDKETESGNKKRTIVTYDQRQEGKFNVRADLENFVIVFVPSSPSQGMSLLDMLSTMRRNQAKNANKRIHSEKDSNTIIIQQDEKSEKSAPLAARIVDHFIEGRTPYKVDISSTLSQLHPETPQDTKDTGIITSANSPPLYLVQSPEGKNLIGRKERSLRPFDLYNDISSNSVVALTNSENINGDGDLYHIPVVHNQQSVSPYLKELTDSIPSLDSLALDLSKDVHYVNDDDWKLLGASEPGCGPDMRRDSYGICRYYPTTFN